jgi:PAS domain S-box-containing protein
MSEDRDFLALERKVKDLEDKTARLKESEESVRKQNFQLEEVGQMGYWEWDLASGSVNWSDGIFKIMGLDPSQRFDVDINKVMTEIIHPDDSEIANQAIQKAIDTGKLKSFEFRVRRPDGKERIILCEGLVDFNQKGEPIALFGIDQDITEKVENEIKTKALEEELRQSQKMQAVGRLAGGIAHDFNNLLSVILNYAVAVKDHLAENSPMHDFLNNIEISANKGADLVRQLLIFSHKDIILPQAVNLSDLVSRSSKMIESIIGEDIELVTHLSQDLWMIKIDPGQAHQILVNLAVNSREAMPNGGELTIKTTNFNCQESSDQLNLNIKPGKYVALTVSDNGSGITPENLEHIFEPFFTTKDIEKGAGLGLATVYGIVQRAGGSITVESTPGEGTTFRIYLPRSEEQPVKIFEKIIPTEKLSRATLLVVEDNQLVLKMLIDLLGYTDYKIIPAENAKAALEVFEKSRDAIDILLTDVIMPEMDGIELAGILLEKKPQLQTIFMSGYSDDILKEREPLKNSSQFIQKPFTITDLVTKVENIIKAQQ